MPNDSHRYGTPSRLRSTSSIWAKPHRRANPVILLALYGTSLICALVAVITIYGA